MKPSLERLPMSQDESFIVRHFDYPFYPTPWHYHPEYELVLVTESSGKKFIGDHLSDFAPGDLVLLGPNIPHTYRNDEQYYEERSVLRAKSIVVHFSLDTFGVNFFELPESKPIWLLLERSALALSVRGEDRDTVSDEMLRLVGQEGLRRWHTFMGIMTILAESPTLTSINASPQVGNNEKESARLCSVFDWIYQHFTEEVRLSDAARVAGMTESAFSRYFSKRTRTTFSGFVQELRLQKAAKLLVNDTISVTAICYDCGYNNVSNFNRQFREYYGCSPLNYKRAYLLNR